MNSTYTLEACVENLQQAMYAEKYGASRIELCSDLHNSGTTPSYGMVKMCKELLTIPIYVIIRPRAGNFIYDANELEIMKYDIEACVKQLNVDGIVIGILNEENCIDINAMKQLIAYTMGLTTRKCGITFHMAFDLIPNNQKFTAIDTLISLGCDRILTKGCESKALDGINNIKDYIEYSKGRIVIMPGGGVTKENYEYIAQNTGAVELHGTKIVGDLTK